jgi:PAS domain S-box-containing protein
MMMQKSVIAIFSLKSTADVGLFGTFQFLDVNEAVIKKYGYSKEEFLKMTIKEIWPEEDYPIFDEGVHSFSHRDNFKKRYLRHKKKWRHNNVEVQSNIIYF